MSWSPHLSICRDGLRSSATSLQASGSAQAGSGLPHRITAPATRKHRRPDIVPVLDCTMASPSRQRAATPFTPCTGCRKLVRIAEDPADLLDRAIYITSENAACRPGDEVPSRGQALDHADIDVLLEQVGREAVAQRVRRDPPGDVGRAGGGMDDPVEPTRGEMVDRVLSGEQPDLRPGDPPPVTQELEQLRREHRKGFGDPLPCSILSSMRLELTSLTLSATTSDTRRPAP